MASITYKRQINKNPKTMGKQVHWSDRQKSEACATYLACGSWTVTSAETKVPLDTLKKWGASEWWKEMEEEIRRASRLETQGKLKKVVDKSLAHLEDRLDNGDYIYNSKTGKIERRKIPARTLTTIVAQGIDKSILLDKIQTQPTQNQDQISTRLAKIQEEFRRFAKAKTIEMEVVPDAVVQELQTRLPAREQVQSLSGADPLTSNAEQGPAGSN